VRETEAAVRRLNAVAGLAAGKAAGGGARDPNLSRLEGDLADKLGAKVELQHASGGRGKLIVSYNSLDELDGILSHIR
jgi:ParB family chromosome partitioning protein